MDKPDNDKCSYVVDPPTYEEFLHGYLIPNRPVMFGPRLVSSWVAREEWVIPSDADAGSNPASTSHINWDHMSSQYGHYKVTVADCATQEFSDQTRCEMLFREVVDLWQSGEGSTLYVKDWHLYRKLAQDSPDRPPFYTTPDIFRDDWMNSYYSAHTDDDFRFVYVGAAGTFTPLHRDVYTSYSWSTNVCGRKRWWLFPPEQTRFLFRKGGEETAFDVRHVDPVLFPQFSETHPFVVEQGEGETIFVPSGWYHQVENLTACVSINHNWCNANNLPSLYASMCAKVVEVEHALEDVRELLSQNTRSGDDGWMDEWVHIVQDVVEKDAGWNWSTFWRMVLHALRETLAATEPPHTISQVNTSYLVWLPAPPHLRPPTAFVEDRIKQCVEHFVNRDHRGVVRTRDLTEIAATVGVSLG